MITEEKENERKKEEQARKEEEEKQKKREELNKRKPLMLNGRLSPAARARESKEIKSQADEVSKGEEKHNTEPLTSPNIDMEELSDMLEEEF